MIAGCPDSSLQEAFSSLSSIFLLGAAGLGFPYISYQLWRL